MSESDGRDEKGKFIVGNKLWLARSSAGPKPKFSDPEALWAACCEYFTWVVENPLWEDRIITYQGLAAHEPAARMRAMTVSGLCLFLDIDQTTWRDWKANRPDLSPVVDRAEEIIRTQKFEGAAADLLNANIIARDLGLADRSEHTGKDGAPIQVSMEEAIHRIAVMLRMGAASR